MITETNFQDVISLITGDNHFDINLRQKENIFLALTKQ